MGYRRVVAFFLRFDEFRSLRDARRLLHALLAHAFVCVRNVRRDRAGEQERLLRYIADRAPDRRLRKLAHVNAVNGHRPLRRVVEAHNEFRHRRFARACRPDERARRACWNGEVDMRENRLSPFGVGVRERHIVERNLCTTVLRKFRIARFGRIFDGRTRRKHFVNTFGRHVRARQHDRDHADDEERHDDDHGIGDERDHVARLDHALVNIAAANPDDKDRNRVHDEHHRRHHEGHHTVGKELRAHEVRVCTVEALFLETLAVERADDGKAREHFARDQVHPVDELLHDLELRHRKRHKDADHHEKAHDREHDNPRHRGIGGRNHDDTADCQNRRIDDHAQQHDRDHLDLLDVVGSARDERSGRKPVDFCVRKRNDLPEQPSTQRAAHFCRRTCSEEAHRDGSGHAKGRHAEHRSACAQQVRHLDGAYVNARSLGLCASRRDSLLVDKGIPAVSKL